MIRFCSILIKPIATCIKKFTSEREILYELLLCFTAATRLRLSTLGFFQYIGATLMFVLAVVFYDEIPGKDKMVTFTFIWVALAIFVMDAVYTLRRIPR